VEGERACESKRQFFQEARKRLFKVISRRRQRPGREWEGKGKTEGRHRTVRPGEAVLSAKVPMLILYPEDHSEEGSSLIVKEWDRREGKRKGRESGEWLEKGEVTKDRRLKSLSTVEKRG